MCPDASPALPTVDTPRKVRVYCKQRAVRTSARGNSGQGRGSVRRFLKAIVFVCLPVLAVGLVRTASNGAAETSGKVRIIYTNDTLGYLEPCG